MIQIRHRFTGAVIYESEATDIKACLLAAIEIKADLPGADLKKANLREADLRGAYLRGANLQEADLREADLQGAYLQEADLRGANLDFSSGFAFACYVFRISAGLRLAAQLAYHFCRFDFGDCEEAKQAQAALKELANKFHRAGECGLIE